MSSTAAVLIDMDTRSALLDQLPDDAKALLSKRSILTAQNPRVRSWTGFRRYVIEWLGEEVFWTSYDALPATHLVGVEPPRPPAPPSPEMLPRARSEAWPWASPEAPPPPAIPPGDAGYLYCFNTRGDRNLYKVGRTTLEDGNRPDAFRGAFKPHVVVSMLFATDARAAEARMMRELARSRVLRRRTDLGEQWFEAATSDVEARHHELVRIVANACMKRRAGEA